MKSEFTYKINNKRIENYAVCPLGEQLFKKNYKRCNTMEYLIKSQQNMKEQKLIKKHSKNLFSMKLDKNSIIFPINKNIENKSTNNYFQNKLVNNIQKIENKNNILKQIEIKDKNKAKKENNKYCTCFLCERSYKKESLFSAKCKIHYFCKDCLNSYFKGLKENENLSQNLECPIYNCHYNFDLDKHKDIFDPKMLIEISKSQPIKNKKYKKNNISIQRSEIYTQKSTIQINTKDELIKTFKNKNYFCPKCLKSIAFYKTNTHFYKCLNCSNKICKYCHKEYTPTHLVINEKDYCKVYYRVKNDRKKNYLKIFLKQLLLVFSMFILCFLISFFLPFHFCKNQLKINNKGENKNNCPKLLLCYILSIIIMIIIFPFIIILYPYFPYFIASLDFN